jgi:glycosyltransferase involved in cell wall biosynthesis
MSADPATDPAPERPFFSIVTVCYNSGRTIARTLESLDVQTCGDWEHVLVDGASKDDTLEILARHAQPRRSWISGKDAGIYDAMNKGLALARGRFVCFLNSDDAFSDPQCLARIREALEANPAAEVLYGDAMIKDDFRPTVRIGREVRPQDYHYGAPIVHQAYFFHRDVYARQGGFDLSVGGGAADWAWLARYWHTPRGESIYLPVPVVDFYTGGASNRFAWENHLARMRVAWALYPRRVYLGYCLALPKHFLKFKLLKLQFDTPLRRAIRSAKSRLRGLATASKEVHP